MKAFKIITRIVVALAAVAGAVYVFATYGDKIAAWCKKMLKSLPCCKCDCHCDCQCDCDSDCDCDCDCTCENNDVYEEVVSQEISPEKAPIAEEADFEG